MKIGGRWLSVHVVRALLVSVPSTRFKCIYPSIIPDEDVKELSLLPGQTMPIPLDYVWSRIFAKPSLKSPNFGYCSRPINWYHILTKQDNSLEVHNSNHTLKRTQEPYRSVVRWIKSSQFDFCMTCAWVLSDSPYLYVARIIPWDLGQEACWATLYAQGRRLRVPGPTRGRPPGFSLDISSRLCPHWSSSTFFPATSPSRPTTAATGQSASSPGRRVTSR